MPQQRPNILLILSDNHTVDLLGSYGNDEVYTPNLDSLAGQGMQFNNAYCVNAMCSPCRASLFTGLMPSQHGVHTWLDDRVMDRWPKNWNSIGEFETLPEILQRNGYKTALIGKYHLGVPDHPQNGFDHWVTFPIGHTRSFWNNTIIENGEQYTYPGHTVDCFTGKAVEYLQDHDPESDDPFFLYLPYNAPYGHWPSIYGPAQNRFASHYDDVEMHSVPREGLSKAAVLRSFMRHHESGDGIDYSAHLRIPNDLTTLRNYFSQMSMVDDGIGRVLETLQQRGLDENTLVIYSCDHGFSMGHNGFWGHGQATFPANAHRPAYHIPLLVRHPGQIASGQENDMMVSQIDLFQTILDYVDLGDIPGNENSPSESIAPLLRGESGMRDTDEGAIFIEQEEVRAIRTKKWLYVEHFRGHDQHLFEDELYDLANDPAEKKNLIGEPVCADVVESMRARLTVYFTRYSDPKYNLWEGGSLKSNSDKPWFWADVWGEDWEPVYQ
ncbi:MAG: sulfatase-like hydrolase/transferase [Chloroflexi bacterium]|nr:sulfatase-like hydrolase/transferase [Chloroflexota bacterium]